MHVNHRAIATGVAGLAISALLGACADAPTSEPSLTPGGPSLGYYPPDPVTGTDPVTATRAHPEWLEVCKVYPAGVAGPAVQVKLHVGIAPPVAGDTRGRPAGTLDTVVTIPANSCRHIWQNGEAIKQLDGSWLLKTADTVSVTEVPVAGYSADTTIVMKTIAGDSYIQAHQTWIKTTDTLTATTSVGPALVGGYLNPGITVVFKNQLTGAIGDFVWEDPNANGIQDAGEPGIPNVTVTLSNGMTTTTDATGHYLFSNVPAGNYTVTVTPPSGYVASPAQQGSDRSVDSDGSPASVSLPAGATDRSIDFGFYKPAALGDFVWDDTNANGIQDAGEPGIPNVTVSIVGPGGTQTKTTDANGAYSFTNLTPGSYTVSVTTPSGYAPTATLQGGSPLQDSNPNGGSVTLSAGQTDNSIDFGFYTTPVGVSCTYTQGYWKNHEDVWPNPYHATDQWLNGSHKVNGMTWDGLLGTPPAGGNSYVQLAHQWIAATLNRANGAPASASVLSTLSAAGQWLLQNTPASGSLPSIKNNSQANGWATTLDSYNNGLAGTPHCN